MKTIWHLPCFNRTEYLCNSCKGKRVIDLGFAAYPRTQLRRDDGNLLSDQLNEVAADYLGIDAKIPEGFFDDRRTMKFDLGNRGELRRFFYAAERFKPDVVVAAELIEHLSAPGLLLDCLAELGVEVLITVPNSMSAFLAFHSAKGQEIVHEDHVCWYTPSTLSQLLGRHGFVSQINGYPEWNPLWLVSTRCFGLIAKARPTTHN